jgi:hypothetical protein
MLAAELAESEQWDKPKSMEELFEGRHFDRESC